MNVNSQHCEENNGGIEPFFLSHARLNDSPKKGSRDDAPCVQRLMFGGIGRVSEGDLLYYNCDVRVLLLRDNFRAFHINHSFLYFAVRFICRARQMNLSLGGLHSLRIYASAERQCKVKFKDELKYVFFF